MKLEFNININWPIGEQIMSRVQEELIQLREEVKNVVGVQKSAVTAINGIATRIQAATDVLEAEGANVSELRELETELAASSEELATAITTIPAETQPAE